MFLTTFENCRKSCFVKNLMYNIPKNSHNQSFRLLECTVNSVWCIHYISIWSASSVIISIYQDIWAAPRGSEGGQGWAWIKRFIDGKALQHCSVRIRPFLWSQSASSLLIIDKFDHGWIDHWKNSHIVFRNHVL